MESKLAKESVGLNMQECGPINFVRIFARASGKIFIKKVIYYTVKINWQSRANSLRNLRICNMSTYQCRSIAKRVWLNVSPLNFILLTYIVKIKLSVALKSFRILTGLTNYMLNRNFPISSITHSIWNGPRNFPESRIRLSSLIFFLRKMSKCGSFLWIIQIFINGW